MSLGFQIVRGSRWNSQSILVCKSSNLYIYFVIYTNKFGIKEKSTQLVFAGVGMQVLFSQPRPSPISVVSQCFQMSSLLSSPNSIQQFKCLTTLYMLPSVFQVWNVFNVVRDPTPLPSTCTHFCGQPVGTFSNVVFAWVGSSLRGWGSW